MPVIQLPTDTRWSQLGTGLGTLLGEVVQARQQNRVAQGVGQIMQDPNLEDGQKAAEVLKQYGAPGWNVFTQAIANQVRLGQLGVQSAEVKQKTAQAGLEAAQTNQLEPKTRAQIDKDAAEAQAARARAALAPGENQLNFYRGQKEQAEAAKAAIETKRLQDANAGVQAGAAPPPAIQTALKPYEAVLPADQLASAATQGQQSELVKPGTGAKTAGEAADRLLKAFQGSADTEKLNGNLAEAATSSLAFVDAFEKAPNTGTFKGVTVQAWLERHGVATGHPEILAQAESDILQASTLATQGGGFFSIGRFKLAQDMVPSLRNSPLANVIKLDQLTDRAIADLQARQDTEPRSRVALQKTIDKWQKVKDWTSSYQSYQTAGARTAMIHNGDQIDSGNFKVLIKGTQTYKLQGGQTLTGAQIIHDALNFKDQDGNPHPIDPQLYMAALQRQGQ